MTSVLYLHGFASSPRGRKVEALDAIFRPAGIALDAPDLNVPSFARLDFEAMVGRARAAAAGTPPDVIVGSSLGALVALAIAPRLPDVPLVLVAPALGFGRRWVEKLPPGDPLLFFHFGENRERPIHRAFFVAMAERPIEGPPSAPVTVVMGTRDESVPIEVVREIWEEWRRTGALDPVSRFVEIPGGDHGLTGFVGELSRTIRHALERTAAAE